MADQKERFDFHAERLPTVVKMVTFCELRYNDQEERDRANEARHRTRNGGSTMGVPKNLLYSKDHEWVKKENDGKVRIGITDYAQKELGDIVFVELPERGAHLNAGDSFGSVESVKTVSELYAPVGGTVAEVNASLEDAPELVNESPYEKAWMIVLESADQSEEAALLAPADYEKLTAEDA